MRWRGRLLIIVCQCNCILCLWLGHACLPDFSCIILGCLKNSDCDPSPPHMCVNFLCVKRCTLPHGCAPGLGCANGACSLQCTDNTQCMSGQICQKDGTCAQLVSTDPKQTLLHSKKLCAELNQIMPAWIKPQSGMLKGGADDFSFYFTI